MLKDVVINLYIAVKNMSALFQEFRKEVHMVKPDYQRYKDDRDHRPIKKTGKTRNSRKVQMKGATDKVKCRLNGVTANMQGILAFLAMIWLWRHYESCDGEGEGEGESEGEGDSDGEGGAKCQHSLVVFMTDVTDHTAFGKAYTAKTVENYAKLMDISGQYDRMWHSKYASQYIHTGKEARYTSFQALIAFLRYSKNIDAYTEDEMADIVDGFVSLCALPDSKFGACFDQYDGKDKDAFYDFLVKKIEQVVEEMWCGKSHDSLISTDNRGGQGMDRELYYNLYERYFTELR
jgi:hypothetical protein